MFLNIRSKSVLETAGLFDCPRVCVVKETILGQNSLVFFSEHQISNRLMPVSNLRSVWGWRRCSCLDSSIHMCRHLLWGGDRLGRSPSRIEAPSLLTAIDSPLQYILCTLNVLLFLPSASLFTITPLVHHNSYLFWLLERKSNWLRWKPYKYDNNLLHGLWLYELLFLTNLTKFSCFGSLFRLSVLFDVQAGYRSRGKK